MATAHFAPTPEPPLQRVRCRHGDVAWREAGRGTPLVLLHGIGSGSASWVGQFEGLADTHRVIAWDAPGYGGSAALEAARPLAGDYVRALAEWLAAIGVTAPCVVGHSLGAIVAAAWAAAATAAVSSATASSATASSAAQSSATTHTAAGPAALVLASPARGYGAATEAERSARYQERLALVEQLGIEGLAAQRSANLCAPGASAAVLEVVRSNMARATAGGYRQAAHLLAHDDLATHLASYLAIPLATDLATHSAVQASRPGTLGGTPAVAVLCGELDRVTPPQACRDLAERFRLPFSLLPQVAHACYVENPLQFNAALRAVLGVPPSAAVLSQPIADHHV